MCLKVASSPWLCLKVVSSPWLALRYRSKAVVTLGLSTPLWYHRKQGCGVVAPTLPSVQHYLPMTLCGRTGPAAVGDVLQMGMPPA
jgi:hypothetical protein